MNEKERRDLPDSSQRGDGSEFEDAGERRSDKSRSQQRRPVRSSTVRWVKGKLNAFDLRAPSWLFLNQFDAENGGKPPVLRVNPLS